MIVIIGPTASGKDTIAKKLVASGAIKIPEVTTRAKRATETGSEYVFLTEEEYKEKEAKDELIAKTSFNYLQEGKSKTVYYGLLKELVDKAPRNAILVTNVKAAKLLKEYKPDIIVVRMIVKREEQVRRLKNRGDKLPEIKRRVEADDKDLAENYVLTNIQISSNSMTDLDNGVSRILRFCQM